MLQELLFDLMEVCVHQLLRERGVYPRQAFVRCIKHGVPTWRAEPTLVKGYVSDSLKTIRETVSGARRWRVDLVLLDGGVDKETYVFDVDMAGTETGDGDDDVNISWMELHLRSLLLRLSAFSSRSEPLRPSEDLSFSLRVHLSVEAGLRMSQGLEWATVDKEEGKTKKKKSCDTKRMEPIFGMSGPCLLQLYMTK